MPRGLLLIKKTTETYGLPKNGGPFFFYPFNTGKPLILSFRPEDESGAEKSA